MLRYKIGFLALVVMTLLDVGWIAAMGTASRSTPLSRPAIKAPVTPGAQTGAVANPSSESTSAAQPPVSRAARATSGRPAGVPSSARRARVVDHVDGDTLKLIPLEDAVFFAPGQRTTVRLLEIDSPESVDPTSPKQCYARQAAAALRSFTPRGETVWAAPDRDLLDPYRRTLLYLWTEDGRFINLEMVKAGFAKAVLYEPNDQYISVLRRAERQARRDGKGLWNVCDYFGQPIRLGQLHTVPSKQSRAQPRTDARFDYCYLANEAGYGNYVSGRDPEYNWYDDADSDGVVCEF